jgi:hypothetical protein
MSEQEGDDIPDIGDVRIIRAALTGVPALLRARPVGYEIRPE